MENKAKIKELVRKFETTGKLEFDEMTIIVQEMQRAQLEVQELKRKDKETESFWKNYYDNKIESIVKKYERKAKREKPKTNKQGYCPQCKHLVYTAEIEGKSHCTVCLTPTEEDEFDE